MKKCTPHCLVCLCYPHTSRVARREVRVAYKLHKVLIAEVAARQKLSSSVWGFALLFFQAQLQYQHCLLLDLLALPQYASGVPRVLLLRDEYVVGNVVVAERNVVFQVLSQHAMQ